MIIYHVPEQVSRKYFGNPRVVIRASCMQWLIYLTEFQRLCWYHNICVSVHTIILYARWRHSFCSSLVRVMACRLFAAIWQTEDKYTVTRIKTITFYVSKWQKRLLDGSFFFMACYCVYYLYMYVIIHCMVNGFREHAIIFAFLSFLENEMVHVIEILACGKEGLVAAWFSIF